MVLEERVYDPKVLDEGPQTVAHPAASLSPDLAQTTLKAMRSPWYSMSFEEREIGRSQIALRPQHKIDSATSGIHCLVEVGPVGGDPTYVSSIRWPASYGNARWQEPAANLRDTG